MSSPPIDYTIPHGDGGKMRGASSIQVSFANLLCLQVMASPQVPITGTAATQEPRSPAGITTARSKPVFINTAVSSLVRRGLATLLAALSIVCWPLWSQLAALSIILPRPRDRL